MNIRALDNASFNHCFVKQGDSRPQCKLHGSLICVSVDDNEKVWRCIRSSAVKDCRAGCVSYKYLFTCCNDECDCHMFIGGSGKPCPDCSAKAKSTSEDKDGV